MILSIAAAFILWLIGAFAVAFALFIDRTVVARIMRGAD